MEMTIRGTDRTDYMYVSAANRTFEFFVSKFYRLNGDDKLVVVS